MATSTVKKPSKQQLVKPAAAGSKKQPEKPQLQKQSKKPAAAAAPSPAEAAAAAIAAAKQLPGLDPARVRAAVAALIKHAAAARAAAGPALFDDDGDEFIHLQLALERTPAPALLRRVKPARLPVPHALLTLAGGAEVALFVKDSKGGEGHKAAKARLSKFEGKGGVTKVIGTSKLRTKYESHEAKRRLCASYDLFLADERILPSLPKLLGKSFFKRRKVPIPIDIRSPNFPAAVKRAVEQSAYMAPPAGSCVSVRAARVGMGADAAADNVLAALAGAAARVPQRWANVQAVYVKTGESVALPVFQTLPDAPPPPKDGDEADAADAGGKKSKKRAAAEAASDDDDEEDEEEQRAPRSKQPKKQKVPAAAKQQKQKQQQQAAEAEDDDEEEQQQQQQALKKGKGAKAAAKPAAAGDNKRPKKAAAGGKTRA